MQHRRTCVRGPAHASPCAASRRQDDHHRRRRGLRRAASLALAGAGLCFAAPTWAANWFEVQGVSNPAWGRGKLMGWVEPDYTRKQADTARNGLVPRPNLVGPRFAGSDELGVQRAQLVARGRLHRGVDYFLAGEFGANGYTYGASGYSPKLIDAHVLLSHYVPGVRVEAGILRAPGPEEAMAGYMDYSFFSLFPTVVGQLMQPGFYARSQHYAPTAGAGYLVPSASMSSNNGFRYPGVEATDWFRVRPRLELAYGLMLGEYGKAFEADTGNGPLLAARVQGSWLLGGGKGPYRNDVTGFVWYQQARPELNGQGYAMHRSGFGLTLRHGFMRPGAQHLKLEYMRGSGLIAAPSPFVSTPGLAPALVDTTVYPGSNNTAHGYYLSAGVFVTRHVELDARYDVYDRLPNLPAQERDFRNLGVGVQYHFTPLTRVVVDYFHRRVGVPNPDAIGPANSPARLMATSVAAAVGNELDVYAVISF